MKITTVGVDLAKNLFQLVGADEQYRVCSRQRFSRSKFSRWMANLPPCRVVMEACGSAHYWARVLQGYGHEVKLLPAQHVRAYVRRNKTDAADAAAMIEASRCEEIRSVPIKTAEQQAMQHLHRLRTQWQQTRTARINAMRGLLREFGIDVPLGAVRGLAVIREALEDAENGLPNVLRSGVSVLLSEVTDLESKIKRVDADMETMSEEDTIVQRLREVPGVGPLTATAARVAISDIHRFASGRHLASWMGLTACEHSSGETRRLGRISKRGDPYLRQLLIHGARSVLHWAKRAMTQGRELDRLRRWAVQTEQRIGTNKAVVALANKLARILWATWKHDRPFNADWSSTPHAA